jgi:hypothetical protein
MPECSHQRLSLRFLIQFNFNSTLFPLYHPQVLGITMQRRMVSADNFCIVFRDLALTAAAHQRRRGLSAE